MMKKMNQKFTFAEDELLIDLVKQHPALYNCKLKSYRDIVLRNKIWKQVGVSLNKSENDCKARWKHIRDYYRKRRNEAMKELGSSSQTMENSDFFKKNQNLLFLENTAIAETETASSLENNNLIDENPESSYTAKVLNSDEEVPDAETIQDSPVEAAATQSPTDAETNISMEVYENARETSKGSSRIKSKRKYQTFEENICMELKKSREGKTELSRNTLPLEYPPLNPAITTFFQSIATTVNSFIPQLQARAKMQIMNIVGQLELENISQQESMAQPTCPHYTTREIYSRPSSSGGSECHTDISHSYSQTQSVSSNINVKLEN
ncbi:uncharacterized protein [Diabrotica undecimpunctata]|uniref:uncharacterized protein n=1 Tax=Diabrotica undecimpunctata TaxID=50387 RepID=UPI003B63EFBD